MAKVVRKISNETVRTDPKKAVVFGSDARTLRQICDQLGKKNMRVWPLSDEKLLLLKLNEADPDLILVEINAVTHKPIDKIVADIFIWMRARARAINKILESPSQYLWQRSKVVLFKSDSEITATGSLSADVADIDDVVRQCSFYGDVKYIGLYASMSFISKIRPLID